MTPEKILSLWENTRIPVELSWTEVETICNWLRKRYRFNFYPTKRGSHYILAHDLLCKYKKALINNGIQCKCNDKGQYSIKRESKVKKVYLEIIFEAYTLVKGL